ncbi:hypothetical protein CP532_0594 [Ophiocordyceps camponoti-leonardi (nom. inval.)]|nr:hypothetical protein CP532_0594 [Ophiocordyceps camponoti-leonardi (nom. inval.)]
MARKKTQQPSSAEGACHDKPPLRPSEKKSSKSSSVAPAASSLIICRNKHWRHISSFHGAWLQIPTEILETIANVNYNTLRPRPIDPAILFDLIKIRKNVDEAADLAVRAASDTASPTLSSVHGGLPGASSMNAFGLGLAGHGTARMSRERRFRMRELASQKLARAYRLDEIASSVATMQGASTLEDIGGLVLQHSPNDSDAKYVHFFHEKIPSRQLAESTSLRPLQDIMSARAAQPEVLRTLATVKMFKDDLEGAAQDLTEALSMSRFRGEPHRSSAPDDAQKQAHLAVGGGGGRRRPPDVILSEDEQPSGLDSQLLFQRGCVYLCMASQCVPDGIPEKRAGSGPGASDDDDEEGDDDDDNDGEEATTKRDGHAKHDELLAKQAESRRFVKSMAKRALRDLMAFLAQFDYAPDLPVKLNREFNERVFLASQGVRSPRCFTDGNGTTAMATTTSIATTAAAAAAATQPHTVYPLPELFAAVPPANLPPYPNQELVKHDGGGGSSQASSISATATTATATATATATCEWVTYHPLLTEALHALLLSHCLAQTSAKELQRHAYMVARLVRLCDGYPVFQASRSPARTDWVEVLRRTKNWLRLCASWETLCFPAPLPLYEALARPSASSASASAPNPARASAAAALINASSSSPSSPSSCPSPSSPPSSSLTAAEKGKPSKSAAAAAAAAAVVSNDTSGDDDTLASPTNTTNTESSAVWWATEAGKDYPVASDRSVSVAQWVLEAPLVKGARRRRRVKKVNKTISNKNNHKSSSALDDNNGGET